MEALKGSTVPGFTVGPGRGVLKRVRSHHCGQTRTLSAQVTHSALLTFLLTKGGAETSQVNSCDPGGTSSVSPSRRDSLCFILSQKPLTLAEKEPPGKLKLQLHTRTSLVQVHWQSQDHDMLGTFILTALQT